MAVEMLSPVAKSREVMKMSDKLSMKMKKLKCYINAASNDFKKAKKALDSLNNSARSLALNMARSKSRENGERSRSQSQSGDKQEKRQ